MMNAWVSHRKSSHFTNNSSSSSSSSSKDRVVSRLCLCLLRLPSGIRFTGWKQIVTALATTTTSTITLTLPVLLLTNKYVRTKKKEITGTAYFCWCQILPRSSPCGCSHHDDHDDAEEEDSECDHTYFFDPWWQYILCYCIYPDHNLGWQPHNVNNNDATTIGINDNDDDDIDDWRLVHRTKNADAMAAPIVGQREVNSRFFVGGFGLIHSFVSFLYIPTTFFLKCSDCLLYSVSGDWSWTSNEPLFIFILSLSLFSLIDLTDSRNNICTTRPRYKNG